jgi:hypothetical protein
MSAYVCLKKKIIPLTNRSIITYILHIGLPYSLRYTMHKIVEIRIKVILQESLAVPPPPPPNKYKHFTGHTLVKVELIFYKACCYVPQHGHNLS